MRFSKFLYEITFETYNDLSVMDDTQEHIQWYL